MTIARCIALMVSFSIAGMLGSGREAGAEPRKPLSSAQIRHVLSQHAPALRECYVQHSMQQQGSMGSLTLELLVRASGQVAALEVQAPGTDKKKVEQCVSRLVKTWRFPRSSDETLVKYPMMFLHTQKQAVSPAPERGRDQANAKKKRAGQGRTRVATARR
jgi:hypothetical protein